MKNCPICNSVSKFAFETKFVKVNQCKNQICEHLFAIDVQPYQGVHDFESDQKKDYSIYNQRNIYLIEYLKRINFIKPAYSILDFGSGTGHLLRSLFQHVPNIEITAVEFNNIYHANLKNMGCTIFKTIDEIPLENTFDAIALIEVIEHLDNPLEIVSKLKKRLKHNKKIFVTTPAGDFRKTTDKKWELNAYNSQSHVQFFTEKSIKLCFKKAGFTSIRYKYINSLYPNKEYGTIKSKINTLKGYYTHWRGLTGHLTYIVS